MIHPTAIVHPNARVAPGCELGPYCVVGEHVTLGENCKLHSHVVIDGHTRLGRENEIFPFAALGMKTQDLKYKGGQPRLEIGDHNVFREHFTAHRSNKADAETVIGSHNFLMANSHVAHNCSIGNHVILANGALLAGHAVVQDRAFISGNCLVHQFCRVGALAIMQGGAGISKDLPPFCVALRGNEMCGLNVVGLRRAGFSAEARMELKRLYHLLFRGGKNLRDALVEARENFSGEAAKKMLEFIAEARRGVCADTGGAPANGDE